MKITVSLIVALAGVLPVAGCTIRLSGPEHLIVVVEPVDGASNVSLQPTFRWKILDPAIRTDGDIKCQLYEEEVYESKRRESLWMVANLQRHSEATFPLTPDGRLGFWVSSEEAKLKPTTSYIAVFTYSIGAFADFEPVRVQFTTGGG